MIRRADRASPAKKAERACRLVVVVERVALSHRPAVDLPGAGHSGTGSGAQGSSIRTRTRIGPALDQPRRKDRAAGATGRDSGLTPGRARRVDERCQALDIDAVRELQRFVHQRDVAEERRGRIVATTRASARPPASDAPADRSPACPRTWTGRTDRYPPAPRSASITGRSGAMQVNAAWDRRPRRRPESSVPGSCGDVFAKETEWSD